LVDLMATLRRSVGGAAPAKAVKSAKKPRKAAAGQKETLVAATMSKPSVVLRRPAGVERGLCRAVRFAR
jgi:DNA end-binding protein Ku